MNVARIARLSRKRHILIEGTKSKQEWAEVYAHIALASAANEADQAVRDTEEARANWYSCEPFGFQHSFTWVLWNLYLIDRVLEEFQS